MSESVLYHYCWSRYRDLLPEENLSKYFYTYEYSNVSIGAGKANIPQDSCKDPNVFGTESKVHNTKIRKVLQPCCMCLPVTSLEWDRWKYLFFQSTEKQCVMHVMIDQLHRWLRKGFKYEIQTWGIQHMLFNYIPHPCLSFSNHISCPSLSQTVLNRCVAHASSSLKTLGDASTLFHHPQGQCRQPCMAWRSMVVSCNHLDVLTLACTWCHIVG